MKESKTLGIGMQKLDERDIQAEIARMRDMKANLSPDRPKLTASDVAKRFGKSVSWANSRMNLDYMPKSIRAQLKGVCLKAYAMHDKNTLMGGRYFCTYCMEYVEEDHFNGGKA